MFSHGRDSSHFGIKLLPSVPLCGVPWGRGQRGSAFKVMSKADVGQGDGGCLLGLSSANREVVAGLGSLLGVFKAYIGRL